MEKERSVAIQICMLIFVLTGIAIEIVYYTRTPSCSVGVPGTAAIVMFQSSTARDDCRELVSSGNFSMVTLPINEPAICGEQGLFLHYTVYAEGVFDREGETLCQTLPILLASECPLDDPQSTRWAIIPLDQDEDVSQSPSNRSCQLSMASS